MPCLGCCFVTAWFVLVLREVTNFLVPTDDGTC